MRRYTDQTPTTVEQFEQRIATTTHDRIHIDVGGLHPDLTTVAKTVITSSEPAAGVVVGAATHPGNANAITPTVLQCARALAGIYRKHPRR